MPYTRMHAHATFSHGHDTGPHTRYSSQGELHKEGMEATHAAVHWLGTTLACIQIQHMDTAQANTSEAGVWPYMTTSGAWVYTLPTT